MISSRTQLQEHLMYITTKLNIFNEWTPTNCLTAESPVRRKIDLILSFTVIFNPIHTGIFGWCSTGLGGWGVFYLHSVAPLSFESDDSNFVQNYFGLGSIFWGKKNRDQIDNDVAMTSSLL